MTFWKRRNVVPCFIIYYRKILLLNVLRNLYLFEKKKRTYLNSYCSSNKDLLGFSANREICHVLAFRQENFRGGFVSPLCNHFKEFLWYFTFNFSFGFNEMVLGEVRTSQ